MEPSLWNRYWRAFLCDGQPGCEDAVRLMSEVLAEDPAQLSARVHRGKAYALLGRADEAAADFRGVLDRDPQNWEARVNLAALYILLGVYAEAEHHLRQTLARADPGGELPEKRRRDAHDPP